MKRKKEKLVYVVNELFIDNIRSWVRLRGIFTDLVEANKVKDRVHRKAMELKEEINNDGVETADEIYEFYNSSVVAQITLDTIVNYSDEDEQ